LLETGANSVETSFCGAPFLLSVFEDPSLTRPSRSPSPSASIPNSRDFDDKRRVSSVAAPSGATDTGAGGAGAGAAAAACVAGTDAAGTGGGGGAGVLDCVGAGRSMLPRLLFGTEDDEGARAMAEVGDTGVLTGDGTGSPLRRTRDKSTIGAGVARAPSRTRQRYSRRQVCSSPQSKSKRASTGPSLLPPPSEEGDDTALLLVAEAGSRKGTSARRVTAPLLSGITRSAFEAATAGDKRVTSKSGFAPLGDMGGGDLGVDSAVL